MQITVPDGGEDGRIEWTGGIAHTDYFPSNFVIFQSKAKKTITTADIKGEIAKKKTKNKRKFIQPSDAIKTVIDKHGSYILFTSAAMVTKTIEQRKADIVEAIQSVGLNHAACSSIEIYDANKIANWVNNHSAVALWVNEILSSHKYNNFFTYATWGKLKDNYKYKYVDDAMLRFNISGGRSNNCNYSFGDAKTYLLCHIEERQNIIRAYGASGFGKSRFVYEVFDIPHTQPAKSIATNLIYCNAYIGQESILALAHDAAISAQRIILVVDDCEDDLHQRLAAAITMKGSECSLLTINTESTIQPTSEVMVVSLGKASEKIIEGIAEQNGVTQNKTLVTHLADGFPRMAVMAVEAIRENRNPIVRADELIERILWGNTAPNGDALSALHALCVFGYLGCNGEAFVELKTVAQQIAGMSGEQMYKGLQRFIQRGVLVRLGDYLKAQPLCLTVRLAAKCLECLPPTSREYLLNNLSEQLYLRFLSQIKWLDSSPDAQNFAQMLLSSEYFGAYEKINSTLGAKTINALVNIAPDLTMDVLVECLGNASDDELSAIYSDRQEIVWALEKLAFRKETFKRAANILLRLAANENEHRFTNNSTHYFSRLYQLYLSGTEADPALRLQVLDGELASGHAPTIIVCLNALKTMLITEHFVRSGGAEQIGSRSPLSDWRPQTYGEVYDFHRQALKRLTQFVVVPGPHSDLAAEYIAKHIRELLHYENLFSDIKTYAELIINDIDMLYEALSALHSWIFFDSKDAPVEYCDKVKALANNILPTNPLDQLMIYIKGYPGNFHNPDTVYGGSSLDVEYAIRQSCKLAEKIATDPKDAVLAAQKIISDVNLKSPFCAMQRLAECLSNPLSAFEQIIRYIDENKIQPNINALTGFVRGVISKSDTDSQKCIEIVLSSSFLREYALQVIAVKNITKNDLNTIIELVYEGTITPFYCVIISHGGRLEHLEFEEIEDFLIKLEGHSNDGLFAALDIILMYLHGNTKSMPVFFVDHLKALLLNGNIYEKSNNQMKDHAIEEIYKKLSLSGYCDDIFIRQLAQLLIPTDPYSPIFGRYYSVQSALLKLCVSDQPRATWEAIVEAFECGATDYLINFREGDDLMPNNNPLSELPESFYFAWANDNQEKRFPFILSWLPLTETHEDKLYWHPKIANLVAGLNCSEKALDKILQRMHPGSWIGSLVPYLERFIPLLEEWTSHSNRRVSDWAHASINKLRIKIVHEQKHDAESELRYN